MYMYVVPLIYIDLGVVAFIFIGGTFKVREYFVPSKPTFYKFRPKIIILCSTTTMILCTLSWDPMNVKSIVRIVSFTPSNFY